MIESIDLVVAALGAGAAAGLTDTASGAVKDAYAGLKSLVRKALHRNSADEAGIEQHLTEPEQHRAELAAALTDGDGNVDPELVDAAQRLLALTDPAGTSAGKYTVHVHDNKGVQIGDGNTMTLNFDS